MRFSYSNILLQKSTFTLLAFIFPSVWAMFWLENCPHWRVQLNLLGGCRLHRVWSGLGRQQQGGRCHPGSAPARLPSALVGQPGAHTHCQAAARHAAPLATLPSRCHYLANLHGGIKALVLGETTPAEPSRLAFPLPHCSSSGAPLCMPLRTGTRDKSVFILQIALTILIYQEPF